MRFMIIGKATKDSEVGVMPSDQLIADMATCHEELQKAGVLIDASGLYPTAKGWGTKFSGNTHNVISAPFAETNDLIARYMLIQVQSREEAIASAKRFPNPAVDGREGGARCVICSNSKTSAAARRSNVSVTYGLGTVGVDGYHAENH